MQNKKYYTYIMTNRTSTVLYIGVTDNLIRRVYEHKSKSFSSFTSKYNITKLVYYEIFQTPLEAITREKQLKAGSRAKKIKLIEETNPAYRDLYPELV